MTPDLDTFLNTYQAARTVTCPRCNAQPGEPCKSTGGGNYAQVPTHKPRFTRVAGFTPQQVGAAVALLREVGQRWWGQSTRFAAFEAAATPIPAGAGKQPTPKGVRLSEAQAQEIERAAHNGGKTSASTAHFHGDHQHRQTIRALAAKGILTEGELSTDGYDRKYTLTDFGWDVYRQHRLILRRMSDAEITAARKAVPA